MEIRTIKNGWLVNLRGQQYLREYCNNSEVFCGTKEELLTFLRENLLTAEEMEEIDKERRKVYEGQKATMAATIAGKLIGDVQNI